jgi:undecaprenyl-diphosphatase
MRLVRHYLAPARLRTALAFARREIGAAAALLFVGVAGLVFLHIAEEVGEGDTRGFDTTVLMALRQAGDASLPVGPKWLRIAAGDMTALGSATLLSLIVLGTAGLFLVLKRRREAAWLVLAAAGGTAISQVLKQVFNRERPPLFMHAVEVMNPSFPSGHAMLSAVIYLTLGALVARFARTRRVKAYAMAWAALLTVLVGCSRVYLGVHWPTDVLAGWCLGAFWAIGVWLLAWVLERRWKGHAATAAQGAP